MVDPSGPLKIKMEDGKWRMEEENGRWCVVCGGVWCVVCGFGCVVWCVWCVVLGGGVWKRKWEHGSSNARRARKHGGGSYVI